MCSQHQQSVQRKPFYLFPMYRKRDFPLPGQQNHILIPAKSVYCAARKDFDTFYHSWQAQNIPVLPLPSHKWIANHRLDHLRPCPENQLWQVQSAHSLPSGQDQYALPSIPDFAVIETYSYIPDYPTMSAKSKG